MTDAPRPPLPPFTPESAAQKARAAEDAWNSRDPARVALAYTPDSVWRNRAEFLQGRAAIEAFLTRKWAKELDYRLIKEVWTFGGNRIAVRFAYEWHDDFGNWFRSYGNENWEFADNGLMRRRLASINDLPIAAADRKFHWPAPDRGPPIIRASAIWVFKRRSCFFCTGGSALLQRLSRAMNALSPAARVWTRLSPAGRTWRCPCRRRCRGWRGPSWRRASAFRRAGSSARARPRRRSDGRARSRRR